MAAFASSYIKTVASTVTRNADLLLLPFPFPPQEMTVYCKYVASGSALSVRLWLAGGTGVPHLQVIQGTNGWKIYHHNGAGSTVSADTLTTPAVGDMVEVRVVLNADGSTIIGQSINGGAEATSTTGALALATAWYSSILYVNSNSTSNVGFGAFIELKIASGIKIMQEMRAAA